MISRSMRRAFSSRGGEKKISNNINNKSSAAGNNKVSVNMNFFLKNPKWNQKGPKRSPKWAPEWAPKEPQNGSSFQLSGGALISYCEMEIGKSWESLIPSHLHFQITLIIRVLWESIEIRSNSEIEIPLLV